MADVYIWYFGIMVLIEILFHVDVFLLKKSFILSFAFVGDMTLNDYLKCVLLIFGFLWPMSLAIGCLAIFAYIAAWIEELVEKSSEIIIRKNPRKE